MNCPREMILSALIVAAWLATASDVLCQEPSSEDDEVVALLDGESTQFLEGISRNEMDSAYADLLEGSELTRRTEEIQKLIARTREIETKYGKYRSFERIDAKRIGNDLVLLKYLYKCNSFPVIWYFTYYRDFKRGDASTSNNNWVVIAVRFDNRLASLE